MKRSSTSQNINNKKVKYLSKFQEAWCKEFSNTIRQSNKGENHAFCTMCSVDFKVSHGGKNDVQRHLETKNHLDREKNQQGNKRMQNFFTSNNSDESTKVTKAELIFTNFITQHNLPFAIADHFTKIAKQMFPDSEVAKKFACGKTKTTQILKGAIAPELDEKITQLLQRSSFGLMVDESNDANDSKNFIILARVYDDEAHKVVTRFLDMPICNIGTGENLFNTIDNTLRSRGIPWSNVLAFNSDNASVMKGKRNSVVSRIRKEQPHVVDVGCICHLANLVTKAAVKTLPIKIDDLLIDIYYHFHYRYDALLSYFESHKESDDKGRVQRVKKLLKDPNTKLYLYFLKFALRPLASFTVLFESEGVKIHSIYPEAVKVIRKLMSYFVPMDEIVDVQVKDVPYMEVQLSNEEINCGDLARTYLIECEEDVYYCIP